jgi:hypothetical protein
MPEPRNFRPIDILDGLMADGARWCRARRRMVATTFSAGECAQRRISKEFFGTHGNEFLKDRAPIESRSGHDGFDESRSIHSSDKSCTNRE